MTREEALRKIKGYLTDIIPQEDYAEVEEIVKVLEQEPKTGHWIIDEGSLDALYGEVCECSECGMESIGVSDFCPSCGADMRGEKE